jgi:hypothetical protein
VPLYEVVLRFPDHDEIRLTDRNGYRSGDEILIDGQRFVVTGTEPPDPRSPAALRAECRFVLEPARTDASGRPLARTSAPSA